MTKPKKFVVEVSPEIHNRIKLIAMWIEGCSNKEFVERAIKDYCVQKNIPEDIKIHIWKKLKK